MSRFVALLIRIPLLPLVWFLAHLTVLLLKATTTLYGNLAHWTLQWIFIPSHPLAVAIVNVLVPALSTYASNTPPSARDIDKVLYGFFMAVYMILMHPILMRRFGYPQEVEDPGRSLVTIVVRTPLIPVAWLLAHTSVLLAKGTIDGYDDVAQWMVKNVFRKLHPAAVTITDLTFPKLVTFVKNMPPSEHAFDQVLYGFFIAFYMWVMISAIRWFLGRRQ